jgi:hypothetical protein
MIVDPTREYSILMQYEGMEGLETLATEAYNALDQAISTKNTGKTSVAISLYKLLGGYLWKHYDEDEDALNQELDRSESNRPEYHSFLLTWQYGYGVAIALRDEMEQSPEQTSGKVDLDETLHSLDVGTSRTAALLGYRLVHIHNDNKYQMALEVLKNLME